MALTEITSIDTYRIRRINGESKIRRHLEELGFIPGEKIKVVSRVASGLIVSVKGSRIAINHDTASMIFV